MAAALSPAASCAWRERGLEQDHARVQLHQFGQRSNGNLGVAPADLGKRRAIVVGEQRAIGLEPLLVVAAQVAIARRSDYPQALADHRIARRLGFRHHRRHRGDARAGLGDAHRVDGVRQQQRWYDVVGHATPTHHRAEELRHAVRVEAGRGEIADADPIGLMLFHAREVDALLHCCTLGQGDESWRGIGAAGDGPEQDRAEHRSDRRHAVAALGLDGAGDVPLHNVPGLVRQYAGQLGLAFRQQDQPDIGANEAARDGERVDAAVLHDKIVEPVLAFLGLGPDARAQQVQVFGGLRVVEDQVFPAQLAHHHPPDLVFLLAVDQRIGATAQVGQRGVGRATGLRDLLGQGRGCGKPDRQEQGKAGGPAGRRSSHAVSTTVDPGGSGTRNQRISEA